MDNTLASLHALSQAISRTQDSGAVYTVVQQAIAQQWGEGVGLVVAHYDADTQKIYLPFVWVDAQQRHVEPYALQKDTLTQVIRGGQPEFLARVGDSKERFANICFTTRPAFSLIAAPLVVHGESFGAIAVMDYRDEGRFTEDDLHFLVVVASQMAAHEQVMHTLGRGQQRVNTDRLLYEATTKIRSSIDMQTIVETTANEIGRILSAKRVHVEINLAQLLATTSDGENPSPSGPIPAA